MSGEYSREQIEKMQKDAERRVMEMQRRSKGAMEKEGASFGRQPSSGSPSEKPRAAAFRADIITAAAVPTPALLINRGRAKIVPTPARPLKITAAAPFPVFLKSPAFWSF